MLENTEQLEDKLKIKN